MLHCSCCQVLQNLLQQGKQQLHGMKINKWNQNCPANEHLCTSVGRSDSEWQHLLTNCDLCNITYILRLKDMANHLVLLLCLGCTRCSFDTVLRGCSRHSASRHQNHNVPNVSDVGDGAQGIVHHRFLSAEQPKHQKWGPRLNAGSKGEFMSRISELQTVMMMSTCVTATRITAISECMSREMKMKFTSCWYLQEIKYLTAWIFTVLMFSVPQNLMMSSVQVSIHSYWGRPGILQSTQASPSMAIKCKTIEIWLKDVWKIKYTLFQF